MPYASSCELQTEQVKKQMNRSEQRIPKLRTRGRENRRKLLKEVKRLLHEGGDGAMKFSDIFEAASVSRGSAYRIYIGIDDLMQDLSSEWINNFVAFMRAMDVEEPIDQWTELSDILVIRGADYWAETADTLRVLPRIRSNVPASYRAAVGDLSHCLAGIFDRYFVMPEIPGWLSKMAFFVQICDITYADSVREEGSIGQHRLAEAQAMCRTYLAFYLPTWLPARSQDPTA